MHPEALEETVGKPTTPSVIWRGEQQGSTGFRSATNEPLAT
jgi:hypothetical protein